MANKIKLIERSWRSYLATVVPKDASETQIYETRQAFYAGAAILFTTMTSELFFDDGMAETTDDLDKMQMIQDEIDVFGAELDLRVLGIRH